MKFNKRQFVPDIPAMVDRRILANLIQAFVIVVFSLICGAIGFQLVNEGRWLATALGGAIGMVSATFVSGFIIMLVPPPIEFIDQPAAIAKYQRARRRWTFTILAILVWTAVAVVGVFFRAVDEWQMLCWGIVMFVLFGHVHFYGRVLEHWRCAKLNHTKGENLASRRIQSDHKRFASMVGQDKDKLL